MQNYKIIDVLKSLNRKELTKFGVFVSSPYYNKNQNIIRLLEVLERYYPNFADEKLEIEKIFKKVFPKDKYDYHKINNIVSDLFKLSERFFSTIEFETERYAGKLQLLKQLHRRKLYKLYEQKYRSAQAEVKDMEVKDEEHFNMLYKLYDDYSKFISVTVPNTGLELLQKGFDADFTGSLIKMLRQYNLMIHENFQNNIKFDLKMFDEVLTYIEKNPDDNEEESYMLSLHKNMIKLITTKERKYYDEVARLKELHKDSLPNLDLQLIYINMIDFIAYNVNVLGNSEYYREAFNVNRASIEEGVNGTEGFKYPDFMNFVKIACAVNEFEWAYRFIEEYKTRLHDEEREDVLNFCYGAVAYKKRDLKEALKFYSKSNFPNFLFKVQVKLLLCRIYYELGMTEQTLSMIDTFRHYLKREKMIVENQKEAYYEFLKNLNQLVKIKENFNGRSGNAELENLLKDVADMTTNQFGVRAWLKNNIEAELGKKV